MNRVELVSYNIKRLIGLRMFFYVTRYRTTWQHTMAYQVPFWRPCHLGFLAPIDNVNHQKKIAGESMLDPFLTMAIFLQVSDPV